MCLEAGTAKLDISPHLGDPLTGYWYVRYARGFIDPLYARALVLSFGDAHVAIVNLDLLHISRDVVGEAAQLISKESGISPEGLFVACTHTHTAPSIKPLMNPEETNPEYQHFLVKRIAEVVEIARQRRMPVQASFGVTEAPGLAFNRRLLGPDQRVTTYKPGDVAISLTPSDPVDSTVRILSLQGLDANPMALVVNFGLHPDTTGGTSISADFPGVLADRLSSSLQGSPEVLFLNAPCGDINHLNPSNPGEPYSRMNAIRIGAALCEKVVEGIHHLETLDPQKLEFSKREVSFRVRSPEPDAIQAAQKTLEKHHGPPTKEYIRAHSLITMNEFAGQVRKTAVSSISLGDLAITGMPGEIFSQYGFRIRAFSPFPHNIVVGLVGDGIGYIPTKVAFEQGGYEVKFGLSSYAERDTGEILVEAVRSQLFDLHSH